MNVTPSGFHKLSFAPSAVFTCFVVQYLVWKHGNTDLKSLLDHIGIDSLGSQCYIQTITQYMIVYILCLLQGSLLNQLGGSVGSSKFGSSFTNGIMSPGRAPHPIANSPLINSFPVSPSLTTNNLMVEQVSIIVALNLLFCLMALVLLPACWPLDWSTVFAMEVSTFHLLFFTTSPPSFISILCV